MNLVTIDKASLEKIVGGLLFFIRELERQHHGKPYAHDYCEVKECEVARAHAFLRDLAVNHGKRG